MADWLLRPSKRSSAYVVMSVVSVLLGLPTLFYSLTGLVFLAVGGVAIAQCIQPRAWGWLAVFAPAVVYTVVGGWATGEMVLEHFQRPNAWFDSMLAVVFVAMCLLLAWLWTARPRQVDRCSPSLTN